jgi:hypothetical protein
MFVFAMVELSSLASVSLINNPPSTPVLPTQPTGIDVITYLINNIAYFFTLMTISSSYALLGTIILVPYVISMGWCLLEIIRGV